MRNALELGGVFGSVEECSGMAWNVPKRDQIFVKRREVIELRFKSFGDSSASKDNEGRESWCQIAPLQRTVRIEDDEDGD